MFEAVATAKRPVDRFPFVPRRVWGDVPDRKWNDWRWQMQNRIRDLDMLRDAVRLTESEIMACQLVSDRFRMGITPYYASLMNPVDPLCPVRMQAVPSLDELVQRKHEAADPLAEDRDMPTPGLTHRYPDRVLLYATYLCATYCRHCTRKRKVSDPDSVATDEQLDACIEYIRRHPAIRDVVISGGDPLTLGTGRLEGILARLRRITHVEILRIGTRVPVTLPQRVTPQLTSMLKQFQPLYVNTHFNHPLECTRDAFVACTRLADAGLPLGNQMVLLKGINDDPETVKELNHLLLMMRVRPYYIFMCDPAKGTSHFRTPVRTGNEILKALQGWTSGLALPHFVIDAPGGGGKIPMHPDYVVKQDDERLVLRNYRGDEYVYHLPSEESYRR